MIVKDCLSRLLKLQCVGVACLGATCLATPPSPALADQDKGTPQTYLKIPADSPAWVSVQQRMLVPYFFNVNMHDPRRLPQSAANPLGYTDGAPWEPEYKQPVAVVPGLTMAGPDGLVYPDVSAAGVQGGIPEDLPIRVVIEEDDGDFAGQLEAAVEEASRAGGGVIELRAGVFVLRRPVVIMTDDIVIRGSGSGQDGTVVRYEYGFRDKDILWINAKAALSQSTAVIGPRCELGFQACVQAPSMTTETPPPFGKVELLVDGKLVESVSGEVLKRHWFVVSTGVLKCMLSGNELMQKGVLPGKHTATAVVYWADGTHREEELAFVLDPAEQAIRPAPRGAIEFRGEGVTAMTGITPPLARGADTLAGLESLHLKAGDFIQLYVISSQAWLKKHKVTFDVGSDRLPRFGIYQVKDVKEDGTVELNQPLRFSVDAGEITRVEKMSMLQGCGIEGISMEFPYPNVLDGIYFRYAANSWGRGLRLEKPGVNGFWGRDNKWLEVRDLEVYDGWFKGGGMAYVGWMSCYDSLMDGVKGAKLRHAPCIQYSASGCVIRNGDFEDSDGQFHAGWPHDNLIESCKIRSRAGEYGSYGFGFLFNDRQTGPFNVLYGNDIASENYPGIFFRADCEGSLFLYNRVYVKKGPAVAIQFAAFGHTFIGNTFVMEDPVPSAVYLSTPDCTGNVFKDNQFVFGPGVSNISQVYLFSGAIPPAVDQGNVYAGDDVNVVPEPAVPSLYEWQVANAQRLKEAKKD